MNKMKHYILLLLFYWSCGIPSWGQNNWIKISKAADIQDGDIVLMTSLTTKNGYKQISRRIIPDETSLYTLYHYKYNGNAFKNTEFSSATAETIIFKFIQYGDKWVILDLTLQQYIQPIRHTKVETGHADLAIATKNITSDCYFTFEDKTAGVELINGETCIRINDDICFKNKKTMEQADSKKSNNWEIPLLYRLDREKFNVLDAQNNLRVTEKNSNYTLFYRVFEKDIRNTLILPCPVANYKKVFGEETKVYRYVSGSSNAVYFDEEKDADLKANTPYIIEDITKEPPYLIATQELSYDGNDIKMGDIVGVYAHRPLKENDSFLYGNEFLRYNKQKLTNQKMTISPYKWYIANNNGAAKKLFLDGIEADQTTGARAFTPPEEIQSSPIYNLAGQSVGRDAKALLKGIYIINHKKVIIN